VYNASVFADFFLPDPAALKYYDITGIHFSKMGKDQSGTLMFSVI
jgi:hypothetical protein